MNGDLRDEVTPQTKANELMMQLGVDGRYVLLLEGPGDFKVFNRFVSESLWELTYLEGKENVSSCVNELVDKGHSRFHAYLDYDPFDHKPIKGDVTYTDHADMEGELLGNPDVAEGLVYATAMVRPEESLKALGSSSWQRFLYDLTAPWTALRKFDYLQGYATPMTDFPRSGLDTVDIAGRLEALMEAYVRRSKGAVDMEECRRVIASVDDHSLDRLHRGHHLTTVMAWIIESILQGRSMGARGVEAMLTAMPSAEQFRGIPSVKRFEEWAHSRGTCVWRSELCGCQRTMQLELAG